ncbi:hypothetical protein GCM10010515_57750 [Streptomyces fructofermentans]|uniref:Toxin-antitoxin system, toxin component n=1 Tax=Streptomyces fructofermentans TaxID=152141 RepID=A0A918U2J4_9ACTN|nr:hypothetical protein GCM10010515_57750 [Streptomyces fructofermentans]
MSRGTTHKAMRRLAESFTASLDTLDLQRPVDPEILLDELVRIAAAKRGRNVVLRREIFPPDTATGLWMELEEFDIIAVDRRAAVWHQVVIVGHEIWHMLKGNCGVHLGEQGQAARLLSPDGDLGDAVALATRTTFHEEAEREAEKFGLLLSRTLTSWMEASQEVGTSSLADRIGASLGHRGR